jgi:hypothetical protein
LETGPAPAAEVIDDCHRRMTLSSGRIFRVHPDKSVAAGFSEITAVRKVIPFERLICSRVTSGDWAFGFTVIAVRNDGASEVPDAFFV